MGRSFTSNPYYPSFAMFRFTPLLLLPFLSLSSCFEKEETSAAPENDSTEQLAILEQRFDILQGKMANLQNERLREKAVSERYLKQIRDLKEELNKFQKMGDTVAVSEAPAVQDEPMKKAVDPELRRSVRHAAIGNQYDEFMTTTGVAYQNAIISRITDIGITLQHDKGVARIPFEHLPKSWQERFFFDPERKAIAQEAETVTQERLTRASARRAELKAKKEEEMERKAAALRLEQLSLAVAELQNQTPAPQPVQNNDVIPVNPPIVVYPNNFVNNRRPIVRPPVVRTPVIRPGAGTNNPVVRPRPRPTRPSAGQTPVRPSPTRPTLNRPTTVKPTQSRPSRPSSRPSRPTTRPTPVRPSPVRPAASRKTF